MHLKACLKQTLNGEWRQDKYVPHTSWVKHTKKSITCPPSALLKFQWKNLCQSRNYGSNHCSPFHERQCTKHPLWQPDHIQMSKVPRKLKKRKKEEGGHGPITCMLHHVNCRKLACEGFVLQRSVVTPPTGVSLCCLTLEVDRSSWRDISIRFTTLQGTLQYTALNWIWSSKPLMKVSSDCGNPRSGLQWEPIKIAPCSKNRHGYAQSTTPYTGATWENNIIAQILNC